MAKPPWEKLIQFDKDLILTILNVAPTRRDAKNYLKRYSGPTPYSSRLSQRQSPFVDKDKLASANQSDVASRFAIFKFPPFITLQDDIKSGLARTIRKLSVLGLHCLIVTHSSSTLQSTTQEALEVTGSLEKENVAARVMTDTGLDVDQDDVRLTVTNTQPALSASLRSHVGVIAPIAFHKTTRKVVRSDATLLALTKALASRAQDRQTHQAALEVDKIIIIDSVGGLPSSARREGAHVLVNLRQEYEQLKDELRGQQSHLSNLETMRDCLQLLPSSSTGIITSPKAAASDERPTKPNTLIANVITDKPLFSSSLPRQSLKTPTAMSTILRYGFPVHVHHGAECLSNGNIDTNMLLNLVDDSFGKRLDRPRYLQRLREDVASIVLVGDYEGCAIVTREPVNEDNIPSIVYLDKFAVRKSSQGSGGVADVVFSAMCDTFKKELFWRSRATNPVNKWYRFLCGTRDPLEDVLDRRIVVGARDHS